MWEYMFESSIWSLGGLVIGYVLGRTDRTVRDIKKKVEEDEDS